MINQLSEHDKKTLLFIARSSIQAAIQENPYEPLEAIQLNTFECGAFVTLYCNHELRGCLGRFDPLGLPIGSLITRLAAESAMHDFRFKPIESHELPYVDIHISLLTSPIIANSIEEIELGRHGIKIQGISTSGEKKMGTLLPQVPIDQKWDLDQFLTNTCIKAGLSRTAWKDIGTEIYTYETKIFCDSDFSSPPYK